MFSLFQKPEPKIIPKVEPGQRWRYIYSKANPFEGERWCVNTVIDVKDGFVKSHRVFYDGIDGGLMVDSIDKFVLGSELIP